MADFGDEFDAPIQSEVAAPAEGAFAYEETYDYGDAGEFTGAPAVGSEEVYVAAEVPVVATEQYDAYAEQPVEDAPAQEYEYTPEEPTMADPRTAWFQQNAVVLKAKDETEKAAKQAILSKAKEYLSKFYESRSTMLQSRHQTNRDDEDLTKTVAVPTEGTAWEKVTAMIDFAHSTHQKDVQKYKSTLLACKANNVPVRC